MKVILTPPPPFNGNFPLIDIFYSLCLPLVCVNTFAFLVPSDYTNNYAVRTSFLFRVKIYVYVI